MLLDDHMPELVARGMQGKREPEGAPGVVIYTNNRHEGRQSPQGTENQQQSDGTACEDERRSRGDPEAHGLYREL